jgi:hypothetical protein
VADAGSGNLGTGVGIGLSFVLSSQIYPFMLSSAFTARTIVKEKGEEDEVRTDMWWALGLSILSTVILAFFMHDLLVGIVGTAFAVLLFEIYLIGGIDHD